MLGMPSHLTVGDVISVKDYNTIARYLPGAKYFFSDEIDIGRKYVFKKLPSITQTYEDYRLFADDVYSTEIVNEILSLFSGEEKVQAEKYFTVLKSYGNVGSELLTIDATNPINEFLKQVNKYSVVLDGQDHNLQTIVKGENVVDIVNNIHEGTQGITIPTNIGYQQFKYEIVDSGWPSYAYPYLQNLNESNIATYAQMYAFSLNNLRKTINERIKKYNNYLESQEYQELITKPINKEYYQHNLVYSEILSTNPSILDLRQQRFDLQQQLIDMEQVVYDEYSEITNDIITGVITPIVMSEEYVNIQQQLSVTEQLLKEVEENTIGRYAITTCSGHSGIVEFRNGNNNVPMSFDQLRVDENLYYSFSEVPSQVNNEYVVENCCPGETYTLSGQADTSTSHARLICLIGFDGRIKKIELSYLEVPNVEWHIEEAGWIILSVLDTDRYRLVRQRAESLTQKQLLESIDFWWAEPRGLEFEEWLLVTPDAEHGYDHWFEDQYKFLVEGNIIPDNGIQFSCDGTTYNFFESDSLPYNISNNEFPERTITVKVTDLRPETYGHIELVYVKVPAIPRPTD